MSGTILDMLKQREAELRVRIDEMRAQLAPAEAELGDIQVAKAAISEAASKRLTALPATGHAASARAVAYWNESTPNAQFRGMTMKAMVRLALNEYFPAGATARQLLDLFHQKFGRTDIIRSSLSPQLSRLKVDGVIWRDGLVWRVCQDDCGTIFSATAFAENGPVSTGSDNRDGGASDPPAPDSQPLASDQERQVPA